MMPLRPIWLSHMFDFEGVGGWGHFYLYFRQLLHTYYLVSSRYQGYFIFHAGAQMTQQDVIFGAVFWKLNRPPYDGIIFKQRLGHLLAFPSSKAHYVNYGDKCSLFSCLIGKKSSGRHGTD